MKEVADGQDLIPIQSWRYLLNLHENLPARPGLFLLGWFKLYVCNGAVMIGSFEHAVFGVLHQNVMARRAFITPGITLLAPIFLA